ncbi:MAG: nuclear transport factor 2 family protein [Kangiellaceae bacterium]|jgi:ketosteroid isomerase-like protein|nr:nuclear transport factor 2 family protein [Kangiellaceae bacterium]
MTRYIVLIILQICTQGLFAENARGHWTEQQQEIIELNRFVPLAPKQVGFSAYTELFHPDYTNWYMKGDAESVRSRDKFLALVKQWLDDGNYATYSKVVPISVDVFGDLAYVRLLQEEHFYNPNGKPTKFVGQFVNLMKKHKGKWTFYRTSFQERYRGPMDGHDDDI